MIKPLNPRVTAKALIIESEFNQVHSNKYTYPLLVYLGAKVKVHVVCKDHGAFLITPNDHLSGQGCRKCGFERTAASHRWDLPTFILKAETAHGRNRYSYEKSVYLGNENKLSIICNECRNIFQQSPNHHTQGEGCPKCGGVHKYTNSEFISKLIAHYGKGKFDYSDVEYKTAHTKIKIRCLKCGHGFHKMAYQHLQGQGCPSCREGGFNPSKPAKLYYLSVGQQAYKIGITNRTVQERFNTKELQIIKVIKVWDYVSGAEALAQEQKILKEFSYAKYRGVNLLESGNSELFTHDILGLDTD